MPVFSYTFRDASGGIQKGTADAESEEILRKRFEEQGFTRTRQLGKNNWLVTKTVRPSRGNAKGR